MRKTLLFLAFLLGYIGLSAQEYHMKVFNTAFVIYDEEVNNIENFRFANSQMFINDQSGGSTLNIRHIDSIIFVKESPHIGDTVFITYNGNSVTVDNPFANDGVQITTDGAFVDVESWRMDVPYVVSGSSDNGRLIYYSMTPFHLTLDNLSLTNPSTVAIAMGVYVPVTLRLKGTSTLADGANGPQVGTMDMPCDLTVNGPGTLQITGNAKHAMNIEGPITINSGTIRILGSDSDGIHGSSNLTWNGGTLEIVSAGSDGLDISGNVSIQGGDLTINTTAESQRGIKVSGISPLTTALSPSTQAAQTARASRPIVLFIFMAERSLSSTPVTCRKASRLTVTSIFRAALSTSLRRAAPSCNRSTTRMNLPTVRPSSATPTSTSRAVTSLLPCPLPTTAAKVSVPTVTSALVAVTSPSPRKVTVPLTLSAETIRMPTLHHA